MATTVATQGKDIGNRFYRPELDALRFFAFLAVFTHHVRAEYMSVFDINLTNLTNQTQYLGHLSILDALVFSLSSGVSLFFFLSAYLITKLLIMEQDRTGETHLAAFYARRILRIWPLYFAYLTFVLILGSVLPAVHMQAGEVFADATLMGNWHSVRYNWAGSVLTAILWTVSIEEQFYLFAPIFLKAMKRNQLAAICLLLMLASCMELYWLGKQFPGRDNLVRPNTIVQIIFFAAGTLTALNPCRLKIDLPLYVRIILGPAGVLLWVLSYWKFGPTSPSPFPLINYLMLLAGVLLIFFAALGLNSKLVPRALVYLGKISYGLYIWHILSLWLIAQFWIIPHRHYLPLLARSAVSFALTVTIAVASYRWLERPFLKMKDRFTFVKSRAV